MAMSDNVLRILLCGEVSTGKLSWLNALVGGFISCVSLQRETFSPLIYQLGSSFRGKYENVKSITDSLHEIHKKNQESRQNIKQLSDASVTTPIVINDSKSMLPLHYSINNNDVAIIYDLAGINDADSQYFERVVDTYLDITDLVIYMTTAQTAFEKKSEIDLFNSLMKKIEKQNNERGFIDIIIVVNKFDEIDDEDLNEIYGRIKKKIECEHIFRFSSHLFMTHTIVDKKLNLYCPEYIAKESCIY
jgi:GTPase Era involved in 16S rRNA processing